MTTRRRPLAAAWLRMPLLLLLLAWSAPVGAAELALDPEATHVRIGLGSTLHRIEGTAHLEQGSVDFEPSGGSARGRIVIDARSVETGNSLRDGQLHEKVLESERFPEIVFLPEALRVLERGPAETRVELSGQLEIHGSRHPLAIPATVRVEGDQLHIRGGFDVPHVAWGMRDMSNFLLSVDPVTRVEIDARGRSDPPPARLVERPESIGHAGVGRPDGGAR